MYSQYLEHGICVLPAKSKRPNPIRANEADRYTSDSLGRKRLNLSWSEYTTRLPGLNELIYDTEIIAVCGVVSGGLEVLDFDVDILEATERKEFMRAFAKAVISHSRQLWDKLTIQQSKSGGYHFFYRCSKPNPNSKLAHKPDDQGKAQTLIETRGEGGCIMLSPSNGYKVVKGRLLNIQHISDNEKSFLWDLAECFDMMPHTSQQDNEAAEAIQQGTIHTNRYSQFSIDYRDVELTSQGKPDLFAWYNRQYSTLEILRRNGWKVVSTKSDKILMRRPGREAGIAPISGNIRLSDGLFFLWSSNAGFEPGRAYNAVDLAVAIEYNNNKSLLAKELYRQLNKEGRVLV